MSEDQKIKAPSCERLAFSIEETAKLLGLSICSVRRLLKRGLIRSSCGLRHKRISKKEIDRFLEATLV